VPEGFVRLTLGLGTTQADVAQHTIVEVLQGLAHLRSLLPHQDHLGRSLKDLHKAGAAYAVDFRSYALLHQEYFCRHFHPPYLLDFLSARVVAEPCRGGCDEGHISIKFRASGRRMFDAPSVQAFVPKRQI